MEKQDVATTRRGRMSLGMGLVMVMAVTRVPLYEPHFFNWDATQLGLGLSGFDVAWHQPHPPGYLLYVALGRVFAALFGTGPEFTLQLLATAMSGLGVFGVFVLTSRFRGGAAPWLAAAAAVMNPTVWAYGIVGESYAAEFAACTWIGVLAVDAWRGDRRAMWLVGLCLGLFGGIRTSVTMFMGPLVALALWRCPRPWRHRLIAASLTIVGVAAWLVPTVWLTGGLSHYLFLTRQLTIEVIAKTVSPLFAVTSLGPDNILLTLLWTLLGLGLVPGIALTVWAVIRAASGPATEPPSHDGPRLWVVALVWITPALLFYATIFMSKPGYVLTYAAPFFAVGGQLFDRAVAQLATRLPALRRVTLLAAVALSVVPSAAMFFIEIGPGALSLSWISTAEIGLALALEVPAVEDARLGGPVAVISNHRVLDWRRLACYDTSHLELSLTSDANVPPLGEHVEVFASLGGKIALGSGSPGFWAMPLPDYPREIDVALGPVVGIVAFLPDWQVKELTQALGPLGQRVEHRRHKGLRYVVIDLAGLTELDLGKFRLKVGGEPLTFTSRAQARTPH